MGAERLIAEAGQGTRAEGRLRAAVVVVVLTGVHLTP
jgi:hypothetical protein